MTPVNTSYHVQVPTTTWEFCWSSWTLQCSREVYHVEERTKTENITRVINRAACCPGYKKVDDECIPSCDPPALPMVVAQHLVHAGAVQGGVGLGARREDAQVVGGGRGVLRSATV